jgi:hypothetical protein
MFGSNHHACNGHLLRLLAIGSIVKRVSLLCRPGCFHADPLI